MNSQGRCETPADRRQIIERLLAVWEKEPKLRLGQLIGNFFDDRVLYFIEDEGLVKRLEEMYARK